MYGAVEERRDDDGGDGIGQRKVGDALEDVGRHATETTVFCFFFPFSLVAT